MRHQQIIILFTNSQRNNSFVLLLLTKLQFVAQSRIPVLKILSGAPLLTNMKISSIIHPKFWRYLQSCLDSTLNDVKKIKLLFRRKTDNFEQIEKW